MYTYQKNVVALHEYEESRSITATICTLGYPSRETLYKLIGEKVLLPKEKLAFQGVNTSFPSEEIMQLEPKYRICKYRLTF